MSSRAMTTQLAMMVIIMVHSKTGQLTNQVVSLRTGLEGVNKKREVGPGSATPSFFLPLAFAAAGPPMTGAVGLAAAWAQPLLISQIWTVYRTRKMMCFNQDLDGLNGRHSLKPNKFAFPRLHWRNAAMGRKGATRSMCR